MRFCEIWVLNEGSPTIETAPNSHSINQARITSSCFTGSPALICAILKWFISKMANIKCKLWDTKWFNMQESSDEQILICVCTYFIIKHIFNQSGTKPKLVAKVLLPTLVSFEKYLRHKSNNNVITYNGSVIPHDWDMSFEKLGGLPTVVALWKK